VDVTLREDLGMTVRGVQLFSVPVSDQDRARDFSVDVLGMELIDDQPMRPGRRWVRVKPRGAETAITLVTWFDSMPAGSLTGLVLETDDVDGELLRLRSLGVPIDGGLQEAPWGRYFQVRDPDGNGLILQETEPGSGRFAD
jgi:catechol 2,3-dioxygenase-like lactoylglutathione lyase family enzyme